MTPSVCASLSLKVAGAGGPRHQEPRGRIASPGPAWLPGPAQMLLHRAIVAPLLGARSVVPGAFCAAPGRLTLSIAMMAAALRYPSGHRFNLRHQSPAPDRR